LTFEKYDDFIILGNKKCEEKEKLVLLRNLTSSLPPENVEILRLLILFLGSIAENARVNMMTAYNLAVVFAPNLLRPKLDTLETVIEQHVTTSLVKLLIENYEFLFEIENETNKLSVVPTQQQQASPTASPTNSSVFSQANDTKQQGGVVLSPIPSTPVQVSTGTSTPTASNEVKAQEKILALKQLVKKTTEDMRTHFSQQMLALQQASDKATTVEQTIAIAKKVQIYKQFIFETIQTAIDKA